ncbi:hypothetical protein HG530_002287 [Fusarium avenaceum]|nr:hypothetical protein HG530_002287 [Fusarium avenaceum]
MARPLNQIYLLVTFEVQHGLGGFQTEKTTAHNDAVCTLLIAGELDKLVQVVYVTVYKDTIGVPSFDHAREDSI